MSDVAALIADMVRAGVDPDLIGRTAAVLAERGPDAAPDDDDVRRARNRRYYERKKASEKRLNKTVSDDFKTFKTVSDGEKKEISPCTPFQKKNPLKETPPKGGQKKNPPAAGNVRAVLCEVLSETVADAVIEHRIALRKRLTVRAAELLARQFALMPEPDRAAETMIGRGWQGFEPGWLKDRHTQGGGARAGPGGGGRERMRERQERAIHNLRGDDERDHGTTIDIAAGDYTAE